MTGVAVFIILTSVSNSLNFNQIFAQPLLSSVSSIGAKTYDALSIEAVSNMNVKSIGIDGGQVKYTVSAADDVGNTINKICNHESGSTLSIHMVTCNTPRLLEAVEDTTPPTVSVPNDMILEAAGPDGRMVNYNATATDIVDGILPASCNPKSGSMFALGQTRVECTANDKAGNNGKNEFVITVRDTTPPETTLGDVTVGWLGSITSGDTTPSVDSNFDFDGTDLVGISHYECRLDDGGWKSAHTVTDINGEKINTCTYTGVRDPGAHNFEVRAVDTSGNKDASPASFMWNIEAPDQAIQGLITRVNSIYQSLNLDSALHQAIEDLSDNSVSNDPNSCYLLNSFMNDLNVQNMIGTLSLTDLNDFVKTTLAIMDNIGCLPPIANAGSPQSVEAGEKGVMLDGSNSLHADNPISFNWKQIGGSPTVEIRNSAKAKASFDAPTSDQFKDVGSSTTLTFELTVAGAGDLKSTAITTVEVNAVNNPPEEPGVIPPTDIP